MARGPAGSAIKRIADEAILSDFMIAYVRQNLKCSKNKESLSILFSINFKKEFQAVHTVCSYYVIVCYVILLPLSFHLREFVKPFEMI